MHKTNYPTNLTDKQWQVMEKYLDSQKRKRKHSLRELFNALLYLLKTGCQWRMLPLDFHTAHFCNFGKMAYYRLTVSRFSSLFCYLLLKGYFLNSL